MIETIYTKLPFEKINYLNRPEFHQKEEKRLKLRIPAPTQGGWGSHGFIESRLTIGWNPGYDFGLPGL